MATSFQRAGILELNINTQLPATYTLADADVKKILYQKPDGTTGEWAADTITGTVMTKNLSNTDIDQPGNWQFQTYVEFAGEKGYGEKTSRYFDKALNQ